MKDGRHGGSSVRARLHQLNRMMFAGQVNKSEPSAKPSGIRYALPASAPRGLPLVGSAASLPRRVTPLTRTPKDFLSSYKATVPKV